jgi:hypothetical protein
LPACSRNRTPNSLIDTAGYHVTDDTVYYLKAFPGKAFDISGADVASFQVFDQTYARDESNVYAGVKLHRAPVPSACRNPERGVDVSHRGTSRVVAQRRAPEKPILD